VFGRVPARVGAFNCSQVLFRAHTFSRSSKLC
jgi:hypothetical protein